MEQLSAAGWVGQASGQVQELTGLDPATVEQLASVHDPRYVQALQRLAAQNKTQFLDGDTYATGASFDAASRAAGIGIGLADAIGRAFRAGREAPPVGFALCRPPGHHAIPRGPMGFCLMSTVAITARHIQSMGYRRVLIFDFDVHHGNGTQVRIGGPTHPGATGISHDGLSFASRAQDAFWEDPDVLFISTHQANSYPGTGKMGEVGAGAGEGATINVVLPADSGDAAARAALEEVVGPAADRFRPDFILVRYKSRLPYPPPRELPPALNLFAVLIVQCWL